jgi:hypothetical protein
VLPGRADARRRITIHLAPVVARTLVSSTAPYSAFALHYTWSIRMATGHMNIVGDDAVLIFRSIADVFAALAHYTPEGHRSTPTQHSFGGRHR